MGGKAYVERHRSRLGDHVMGTESDFGAGKIWQITSRVSAEAEPLVALIAGLVEPLGIAPGANSVSSSGPDLTPMMAEGMPAFRFVQDGRDYFDLHHTPDDTLDKVSAANLDQSVAAYVVFAWIAANSGLSDWGWRERRLTLAQLSPSWMLIRRARRQMTSPCRRSPSPKLHLT